MDRIIRASTQKYVNKLDTNREYFTPVQLREAGLPDYLVQRIRLELIRNLQDTFKPSESEWANMNAGAVKHAQEQFLQAIRDEVRLPASYAGSVLESALSDILELLVTPRAFLPDYLFGPEQELDLESVKERCEWIVVYDYFAGAIPRFMEKKGRDKLTREQADRIIERLDERVTSHYTSLNWGQLFEPWFTLMGEKVDPSLFAAFFRDKGKPGVARLFDAESEPIHRTRLIEILSRPQLDEDDDDLADITTFHNREESAVTSTRTEKNYQIPAKPELNHKAAEFGNQDIDKETGYENPKEKFEKAALSELTFSSEKAAAPISIKQEINPKKDTSSSEQKPEKPKQKPQIMPSGIRIKKKFESDASDEGDNLLGRFRLTHGRDKEELPLYSALKKELPEDEDNRPLYSRIKGEKGSDSSKEIPIWQRFTEIDPDASEEEKAETVRERIEASLKSAEEIPEATFDSKREIKEESDILSMYRSTEKPESEYSFFSDSKSESEAAPDLMPKQKTGIGVRPVKNFGSQRGFKEDSTPGPSEIRVHVRDMEQKFVNELFGGDENAYLDALMEIERFKDWKMAGKFISHEIFDRNMIDIYSDTAIDFTDRMQTYFLER